MGLLILIEWRHVIESSGLLDLMSSQATQNGSSMQLVAR